MYLGNLILLRNAVINNFKNGFISKQTGIYLTELKVRNT